MKIVFISDTHNQHGQVCLPEGDILVHCGDATSIGRQSECEKFLEWFASRPFKYKIFVAGNHDWGFDSDIMAYEYFDSRKGFGSLSNARSTRYIPHNMLAKHLKTFANRLGIYYLEDTSVTICGIKFFGSPRSVYFNGWAFNGSPSLGHDWSMIPKDTEILITHGPPFGVLDLTHHTKEHVGDKGLLEKIQELKKLRIHAFGHIHECPGQKVIDGITFINASVCDLRYKPVNPIQVVEG